LGTVTVGFVLSVVTGDSAESSFVFLDGGDGSVESVNSVEPFDSGGAPAWEELSEESSLLPHPATATTMAMHKARINAFNFTE